MNVRGMCMVAVAFTIMAAARSVAAKESSGETNLVAAMTRAETEKKLLFVQYGRETCGNCQALKAMIRQHQVRLSDSEFVYADVNCDDRATSREFYSRFKVVGNMLPFVVIADSAGKQLAARSGYGNAAEFTDFIKETRRAYDKEQKANATPAKTMPSFKPAPTGIPADEHREMRTWTATTGHQVQASLVEERAGGLVVLKKEDGKTVELRETSLGMADRAYLAGLREAAVKPAVEK